jgi:prolyl-tRNA synthetase
MLYSASFIRTLREEPSDAACASHALMLRSGLVRRVANGLFAYLPAGLRALRKLEAIAREELDRAGALEIRPPVMTPGSLWKESGRWDAMGGAMLRARNRLGEDLVVSPTAEELFVAIARGELASYRELPLVLYQINTKYRDEIRPRYGLMRAREFTMMDAYSFDLGPEGLDASYAAMAAAYRRIFGRCSLATLEVRADSGSMGGNSSEEFMVESPIGDDRLLVCPSCGYAANGERACCSLECGVGPGGGAPETRVYRARGEDGAWILVGARVRVGLEVCEAKLSALLGASELALETGAGEGDSLSIIVSDLTVATEDGLGRRDSPGLGGKLPSCIVADIREVREGDGCPVCAAPLRERRGNELGHVFKLGDKYSIRMGLRVLDAGGSERAPLMGCYGVGMDRTLASIIEAHHDENGIVWPASVAPFQAEIVPTRADGPFMAAALALGDELQSLGVEVLLDDRNERAGVKFRDADLLGSPLRLVLGERAGEGMVELRKRRGGEERVVSAPEAARLAKAWLDEELDTLR